MTDNTSRAGFILQVKHATQAGTVTWKMGDKDSYKLSNKDINSLYLLEIEGIWKLYLYEYSIINNPMNTYIGLDVRDGKDNFVDSFPPEVVGLPELLASVRAKVVPDYNAILGKIK